MTTDPLNTSSWKPLEQNWGEGEYVRVIDDNGIDDPLPSPGPKSTTARDRGVEPGRTRSLEMARLIPRENADDYRAGGVRNMIDQTRAALDFLSLPKTGAKAWARAVNYPTDVTIELEEAIARIQHALDLIDIHENG